MAGVSRIEIKESAADLKQLMHEQRRAAAKERLQTLYLLKSEQAESVTHAAELLGRDRVTVQRWMGKYAQGGLTTLLAEPVREGAACRIPAAVQAELITQLQTSEGFGSYGEIQTWLAEVHGVELTYSAVHKHVHYKLQADLKQPRPVSTEQDLEKVAFFKRS